MQAAERIAFEVQFVGKRRYGARVIVDVLSRFVMLSYNVYVAVVIDGEEETRERIVEPRVY